MLPGCGSSGGGRPIPADPANHMIALIEKADQQSAAGICGGAQAKVREAQTVLQNDVPRRVSKSVRQGLADGMDHMISLIQQECQRPQTQTQTETTTTETTTTPTTTTPTTTTPTTTTPTTTTPTTTTPTTTTPTTTTPTGTGTGTGTSTGNGGTPTGTGADSSGGQG